MFLPVSCVNHRIVPIIYTIIAPLMITCPVLFMLTKGQRPQEIQPEVKAVTVPMIKVPKPSQAVCGAIKLPIKPPAAEHKAPARGPKKIPDSGDKTAVSENVAPVPTIGIVGSKCPAATIAAQAAIIAGCIGKENFLLVLSFMDVYTNLLFFKNPV